MKVNLHKISNACEFSSGGRSRRPDLLASACLCIGTRWRRHAALGAGEQPSTPSGTTLCAWAAKHADRRFGRLLPPIFRSFI